MMSRHERKSAVQPSHQLGVPQADSKLDSHQHHGRRRLVLSLVGVVLVAIIAVALAVVIGHFNLVNGCQRISDEYNQRLDKLQKLIDGNQQVAKITADEVSNSDRTIVNDFQSRYKQAKELLAKRPGDGQCAASSSNQQLRSTTNQTWQSAAQASQLIDDLTELAGEVQQANERKELDDAREDLRSTLLSAQSLSANQVIKASVRTQLNRAIAIAEGIMYGDDVDDMVSARKQMDDIIDQINDSLSAANQEIADIEAKVRAIQNYVDDSGSYISAGVDVIHAAGLKEVWGLDNMRGACAISGEQASSWLAAFCTATPDRVYINNNLAADTTNDAYFADAMRHEVAHYLIYRRCGTSAPASIGGLANAESTASSYAVLYLGANRNTLNRSIDNRYHMSQASDEAAARIHAGQCY